MTVPSLWAILIWLLPMVVYLLVFNDDSQKRILWAIVTLVFSWAGLIARLVYGLIVGRKSSIYRP